MFPAAVIPLTIVIKLSFVVGASLLERKGNAPNMAAAYNGASPVISIHLNGVNGFVVEVNFYNLLKAFLLFGIHMASMLFWRELLHIVQSLRLLPP